MSKKLLSVFALPFLALAMPTKADLWLFDTSKPLYCSQEESFLDVAIDIASEADDEDGRFFAVSAGSPKPVAPFFDDELTLVSGGKDIASFAEQLMWLQTNRQPAESVHWFVGAGEQADILALLGFMAKLKVDEQKIHFYFADDAVPSFNESSFPIEFHPTECVAKGELAEEVREAVAGLLRVPSDKLEPALAFSSLGADATAIFDINTIVADSYGVTDTIVSFDASSVSVLTKNIEEALALQDGMLMKGGDAQQQVQSQKVFWATNRKRNSSAAGYDNLYVGERSNQSALDYGIAEVTFPPNHRRGVLEGPLFDMEMLRDPKNHVVLKDMSTLEPLQFFKEIKQVASGDAQGGASNNAVVFVHGFNVPFKEAVIRTAQVAYDIEFTGAPILFSWPSAGSLFGYTFDREAATWSVEHLANFLRETLKELEGTNVHLIAHSMGNQVLIGALQRIKLEDPEAKQLFASIILAAPDFDAGLFQQQVAPLVADITPQWTIYTSDKDAALDISVEVNANKRLGQPVTPIANFDVIDATGIEVSPWSVPEFHSYYATKMEVVDDLKHAIGGQRAVERGLVPQEQNGVRYFSLK